MGMDGLAMVVRQVLAADPFGGAVSAFRGRRGSVLKLLWHDGIGLCLLAKRPERGHVVWPMTSTGAVSPTSAQLATLLEGCEWRAPVHSRRPGLAGWSRESHWRRHGGVGHGAPVQIDLATLPDDPAILQQMLRNMAAMAEQRHTILQVAVQEREAEDETQRLLIQRLLRHRFGRRSEQLDFDQLRLGLEGLEQTGAEGEAAQDAAARSEEQRQQRRAAQPRRNHGALPAHLPRYEGVTGVEAKRALAAAALCT